MIDKQTIDRIFSATDIVEVISDFVNLKRAGSNYKGLSPFTNEKTPSFMVSPSKQIFKCFSSGKGGSAVTFLMEHERFTYPEALKYLAKKYNIEIVEKEQTAEDIQKSNERESMMILNAWANQYFQDNLFKHEEGKAIGLSYLKERDFQEGTIKKFEIGYCLEERDALTKTALKNGYKKEYLVNTGLTIDKENYTFDRFSGRIIFPIHSLSGKVIGFGGRIMKNDKKTAKYLNSPESEIYHKSKVLYGLYYSKNEISKADKCYLVEGYTDVMSMHQNGIQNVAASSGTALTPDQIRLLKRFTNNVTIIFDGDEAGLKASLRGIDLVLEEGMNVKVCLLPEGEDPDSYSKSHSSAETLEFIEQNEKDFITFKSNLLVKDVGSDPVKKAQLIQEIVRSISVIPDRIVRSVYIRECATLLDVEEELLYSEVYKRRRAKAEKSFQRQEQREEVQLKSTPVPAFVSDIYIEPLEKKLIRYLLLYGKVNLFEVEEEHHITVSEYIINEILNDEHKFSNLVYEQFFREFQDNLIQGNILDEKHFIHHQDPAITSIAADLLSQTFEMSKIHERKGIHMETEDMQLAELIPKDIISYKRKILELSQKEILEQIQKAQQEENNEKIVEELMQQYARINQTLNQLSNEYGWVTLH